MEKVRSYLHISKVDLTLSILAITGLVVAIPVFTYMYFAKDLASKEAIMNKNDTGLILLDRNNKPFFTFYSAKYKSKVALNSLPQHVSYALIASEDKDFYSHPGFSIPAIIRAFYSNIMNKDHLYGGSTITQQLVKNALLYSNKTYTRKAQEIILAQEIERRYNKNEILEMYLNFVYFGENAFGIENAAQTYFGKHAKELSVAESAFLTALLPSPSTLSPFSGDIKGAIKRQHIIIDKMYNQNYITNEELESAKKEQLVFKPTEPSVNIIAPHFALMIRDELIKKYGEARLARSGMRVRTTLDRDLQIYAEDAVNKQVEKLHGNKVTNGAAVVMDPKTGEVLALVGSANWFDQTNGKINLANIPRSVGSSFKPIVYAAGIEERIITPASQLNDKPTTFAGNYKPHNYDRTFRGPVSTRRALANSLNVPAVEVMQKVGLLRVLDISKQLGITTLKDPSQYGLSLVLGSGEVKLIELTTAYATFAAQGERPTTTMILDITDKSSRKIFKAKPNSKHVLSPESTFLISSILSDNNARSEVFGDLLTISRPAAVKTGTAEDYRDALTIGYTPSLVVGVWVGNNDNSPMDSVAGSLGAAPIWKELMEYKLKSTTYEPFTPPSSVVRASVCQRDSFSPASEYFISGTQPYNTCRWFTPSDTFPTLPPEGLSSIQKREEYNYQVPKRQIFRKPIQQQLPPITPAITPALTPGSNT